MPPRPASPDPLEQIRELNRLFLKSLQGRDTARLERIGFPAAAVAALREASAEQLDLMADFPRALFALLIDPPTAAPSLGPDPVSRSQQILELTIAFYAWSTCRESAYHARLFFGLHPSAIHALRTTPLSELPKLAMTRARVECAFAGVAWLWTGLLRETRPEVRRQLILVALQPSIDSSEVCGRIAEPRAPS